MILSLHKHVIKEFCNTMFHYHVAPSGHLPCPDHRLFACQANSTKVWRPSSLLWQVVWDGALEICLMPLEFPSQTASQTSSYINRINHYLQQKNDSYLILIGKGLILKGYRSNSNPPNCGQMGSMYVGDACNFKLVVKYTMMLHSHKVQHNLSLYSNLIFLYIFLCNVMQFSQFDIILAILVGGFNPSEKY